MVMLTGESTEDTLLAAVEVGVAGFISKADRPGNIVAYLTRAAAGET